MKTPRKYKTLGLLDLYGFESLAEDPGGFEQLVFNFAAEKVQRVTFEWTMVLGMVTNKMSKVTIFGHKYFISRLKNSFHMGFLILLGLYLESICHIITSIMINFE